MKELSLGTICKLNYGKGLSNYKGEESSEKRIQVFGTNGPIGWTDKALWNEPTIIIGRKGAYRGVHLSIEPSWTIDTAYYLTLDDSDVYLKWLYYRLLMVDINRMDTGAAIPSTKREDFYSAKIKLPRFEIQQRIASILSTYDDLIENNRRRIQLLEQSARLLYKEWFVHFRFPGHEHVKIKNGVPEGWERKAAFEVMEVLSGGTPKTSNTSFWNGDIPFFTPKDTTNYAYAHDTEKYITEAGLKACNSHLYNKDTLFITARGTVGKLNLAQRPMAMNQSCYALVARPPLNQHFLYLSMLDGVEQLRSRAGGAVFDAVVRDTFKLIPFLVPDEKIILSFIEHTSPVLKQIDILSEQVRNLRQARDLLLPKLINGEMAV